MEGVLLSRRFLLNLQKRYSLFLNRGKLMLLYCRRQKLLLGIGFLPFIPSVNAQSDLNVVNNEIVSNKEDISPSDENNPTEETTGWDRLKAVYQNDDYGNWSKEMTAVVQATFMSVLVGIVYGGVISSRIALHDFLDRNQATMFENHIDAKRRLTNHVTLHFAKGGARWAVRLSAFTGGFMLLLVSLSAYRGHTSILDYTLSGALVGSLIRFRLGPPHMMVGGAVGGLLGLMCGATTQGLLSLTGSSLDEVMSVQYEIERSRRRLFDEMVSKHNEDTMDKDTIKLVKQRKDIVDESKSL